MEPTELDPKAKKPSGFCPATKNDIFMLVMLCVNLGLLVLYTVLVSIPNFCSDGTNCLFGAYGFSVGMWLILLELTILLFAKYYSNNFRLSITVVGLLLMSLLCFASWVGIFWLREGRESVYE